MEIFVLTVLQNDAIHERGRDVEGQVQMRQPPSKLENVFIGDRVL